MGPGGGFDLSQVQTESENTTLLREIAGFEQRQLAGLTAIFEQQGQIMLVLNALVGVQDMALRLASGAVSKNEVKTRFEKHDAAERAARAAAAAQAEAQAEEAESEPALD